MCRVTRNDDANAFRGFGIDNIQWCETPSKEGTWGSGYYFVADRRAAEVYVNDGAGVVLTYTANLENPYYFRSDCDSDMPAIALTREIFPEPEAEALIQVRAEADSYYFGGEIAKHLQLWGHDGLIITYEGGSKEVLLYATRRFKVQSVDASAHGDLLPGYKYHAHQVSLPMYLARRLGEATAS